MIILVDFENTHVNGMEGYTYLNETDTVVVYYSDENSAVTRGMVEDLKSRDVNVRMVKLLKQHANALDMYIASTTGMFLDTGEKICIVSKDKGYAAVRDFWHSLRGAEILLGETIEECFLHSVANDDPRIRRVKERSQKALLTNAFETMNRIPTRPTLSRANARKRRNDELDTTKNLEPVAILPNPLLKSVPALPTPVETQTVQPEENSSAVTDSLQIEDALPVSVDNVGASAGESGAGSLNRGGYTNLRPENDRRGGSRKSGRDGRNNRNRNERRNQNEAVFYGEERLPETAENKAEEKPQKPQATKPEKTEVKAETGIAAQETLAAEAEKKTTILNEKKNSERVLPRINKNQIRFVYDPETGTMKKLEPTAETVETAEQPTAETSKPETAAAAAAEVTEEKQAETATEIEAESEENAAAENEVVSLEALGIVPMEALEKYGPGVNTSHQYYVKLVKTFGKAVGKEIFNATKKEMQAEFKRRKQLQQEMETAENAEAAVAEPEAVVAENAAELVEAVSDAEAEIAAVTAVPEEAAAESVETEEEHPVVEALPVLPATEPMTEEAVAEAVEQAEPTVEAAEVQAETEKLADAHAVKPSHAEVSEEEALAAAQYGRYVQLSMDFAENGDINALTEETPTEENTQKVEAEEVAAAEPEAEKEAPVKKTTRKRRSRKAKTEEAEKTETPETAAEAEAAEPEKAKKPVRKRSSRKKTKAEAGESAETESAVKTEAGDAAEAGNAEPKPVRKRGGRRKKAETAEAAEQAEA